MHLRLASARRRARVFFNEVKKVDDNSAMSLLLRDVGKRFSPSSDSRARCFEPAGEEGSRVTVLGPTTPGSGHNIMKTGGMDPKVFKAEDRGFRNGSGDFNFEGNMIRGASGKGREDCVGEALVPTKVDKGSIQPL